MTAQIEVEDLHLHLGSSSGGTNALDGVSLHVNEGHRVQSPRPSQWRYVVVARLRTRVGSD